MIFITAIATQVAHAQLTNSSSFKLLGLFGPEWTASNGTISGSVSVWNEAGFIAGQMKRHAPGGGNSGWLYNPNTDEVLQVGYFGSDGPWTRQDGMKESGVGPMNGFGQIVGGSRIYSGMQSQGTRAWIYDPWLDQIQDFGLQGVEWTDSSGSLSNYALQFDDARRIRGSTDRYLGTESNFGKTAWYFDPTTGDTTIIGHTGPEWTKSNGYSYSAATDMNVAGKIVGYSKRYNGGAAEIGQTTWLYDSSFGSIVDVGLSGSEWTNSSGYQINSPNDINDDGITVGTTLRYIDGVERGRSVWRYDPASGLTQNISLVGTTNEWTRSNGARVSSFVAHTETGQVFGTATRYNGGSSSVGTSVFCFDPSINETINIGLTDVEFTSISGGKQSELLEVRHDGSAVGTARRYIQSSNVGNSIWHFNPVTLTSKEISPIGGEWISSEGRSQSGFVRFGDAGQVIGTSRRYSGDESRGNSCWVFDPETDVTTIHGLFGDEWEDASGYTTHTVIDVTQAGYVMGQTTRFSGNATNGTSVWLHDPVSGTTKDITPTHLIHNMVRSDGYRAQRSPRLAGPGYVIAYSPRFDGMTEFGEATWLYDPIRKSSFELFFATTNGYSDTIVYQLSNDGGVYGQYLKSFDNGIAELCAFYWKVDTGLIDFDDLVIGGIESQGLRSLEWIQTVMPDGAAIGRAVTHAGSTAFYRVKPGLIEHAGSAASWQESGGWIGESVPDVSSATLFNRAANYKVSLNDNATVAVLNVVAGDVDIDLNVYELTVTGTMRVGDPASTPFVTLEIRDGILNVGDGLHVYENATLILDGTINGDLFVDGTLEIGSGDELEILGDLQVDGLIKLELGSTHASLEQIYVDGDLIVRGEIAFEFASGVFPAAGDSFDVLDFASLANHGYRVTLPDIAAVGLQWDMSSFASHGMLSVVPEPASIGVLIGCGALMLRRRH